MDQIYSIKFLSLLSNDGGWIPLFSLPFFITLFLPAPPAFPPPPPLPQLRSLVPSYTPVAGPSLNLVTTNRSGRKSRNKPIKAKVSLPSWRD